MIVILLMSVLCFSFNLRYKVMWNSFIMVIFIYLLAVYCFVVRLFYSTSQMLRRDNREFYLLQAERIEGKKHILTLCSVEWPDAENKDCPRGKVCLKLL